jgi:HAD superfamily hydrolase (TIGR01509 family)
MRRPRALTLDLDDTLLDGDGHDEAIARVCNALADLYPTLDAEEVKSANAEAWRQYWLVVEDDWWTGKLDSAAVSFEGWRRTLLLCGCTDAAVARTARDLHREFDREAHRLYDDVQGLLDFVQREKLPIALVTNGASDVQREKLEVLGLEDQFVAIVVSGELGSAKPDGHPFQTAVQALGSSPSDTWHVGDNLANDVGGARSAGLVAVWLNRHRLLPTEHDPEPKIEVDSLSKLVSVIRAAEG